MVIIIELLRFLITWTYGSNISVKEILKLKIAFENLKKNIKVLRLTRETKGIGQ